MKKAVYLLLAAAAVVIFAGCPPQTQSVEKAITEFGFKDISPVTVEITEVAIKVTVPYGTDLTALIATFSTTGVSVEVDSVEQVSGITPNDFTKPATYKVVAEDGTIAEYIVNVYITVNRAQLENMIADRADLTRVETSGITDMSRLFYNESVFNQDISGWNVSNVTDMSLMFYNAVEFDQDISSWNVSNVTDMHSMFSYAAAFNQNIGVWNVGNVTDMTTMFEYAISFDQRDLRYWNVRNVINMTGMFYRAEAFSQDLSGWNVDNVTEYSYFALSSGISTDQLPSAWQ